MKHARIKYGHKLKAEEIQIRPTNKEFQKVISTKNLLNQHWFLVVPHISILVIYCQNISFHAY